MSFKTYFNNYSKSIHDLLNSIDSNLFDQTIELIKKKITQNSKIIIVGNGGSASIASHVSNDFVKAAKIQSITFNNSNIITCYANDFGHENWIKEAIKSYSRNDDLLILISSSGKSSNIINAAKYCKEKNIDLVTLSGFNVNNELSKLGNINFYINSKNYNFVEMSHHIILVSIVDYFAENKIN